jgi:ankyrin repeat protein
MCYKHFRFDQEEWIDAFTSVCKSNDIDIAKLLMEHKSAVRLIAHELASASTSKELIKTIGMTDVDEFNRPVHVAMLCRNACASGNLALLEVWINARFPIKINGTTDGLTDYNGDLLYVASAHGRDNIVRYLLGDVSNSDIYRALKEAVKRGHTNVVDVLLQDKRVDPTYDDQFVLTDACRNGNATMVKRLLLDSRIDPTYKKNDALYVSLANNNHRIVELLCADGRLKVSIDDMKWACIQDAAKAFSIMARYSKGLMKSHSNALLLHACEKNCGAVVNVLLGEYKADPSFGGQACMEVACSHGFDSILRRLLEDERVDPSYGNQNALITACQSGHQEVVVTLLLDPRVDPTVDGCKPLLTACDVGSEDIVDILLIDARVACLANTKRWAKAAIKYGSLKLFKWLLVNDNPTWVTKDTLMEIRQKRHGHLYRALLMAKKKGINVYHELEYSRCATYGNSVYMRALMEFADPPADCYDILHKVLEIGDIHMFTTLMEDDRVKISRSWKDLLEVARASPHFSDPPSYGAVLRYVTTRCPDEMRCQL